MLLKNLKKLFLFTNLKKYLKYRQKNCESLTHDDQTMTSSINRLFINFCGISALKKRERPKFKAFSKKRKFKKAVHKRF